MANEESWPLPVCGERAWTNVNHVSNLEQPGVAAHHYGELTTIPSLMLICKRCGYTSLHNEIVCIHEMEKADLFIE